MTTLAAAYAAARQQTKFHAKSFYFSSFALPAVKRQRAYAVYALCRLIDDRIDEAPQGDDLKRAVASLRSLVDRLYAGELTPDDLDVYPWLPAVKETIRECEIPRAYIDDLIAGVELDQGAVRLRTWAELDRYCYLVAGVVGLIMTRIFELKDRQYEKQAIELGNAMQLTNILRDIAEDLERNRIYLPQEELSGYGMSEADLHLGQVTPAWEEFMAFQIERAREYYRDSETGIAHLEADGSQRAVWVMRDVYAGILDEIERKNYNVFRTRCFVSFPRKCGLVLRRLLLK
ncbi:MAG: phytoene/squalene synthase family protein [Verrucomicrobiota bacterium]